MLSPLLKYRIVFSLFLSYRFAISRTYMLENLYIPYVIVFRT